MSSFDFWETEFPKTIGFNSAGGDMFSTTVNTGFGGGQQPNRNWTKSLAKWVIDLSAREQTDFELIHKFWLNVGGKAGGFRFWWPFDCSAVNQLIATADGSANPVYQLVKTYTIASRSYVRTILKPITSSVIDFEGNALTNSVTLYDNGTPLACSVDHTTGLCTVTGTPVAGHLITADFKFHFPVRFLIDDMSNARVLESDVADGNGVLAWENIEIQEIR
jgi:uncharacterized protein (TIGR02217 family)